MNTNIQTESGAPYFGARAAGVILIMALVSYIFTELLLVSLLSQLKHTDGIFSLKNSSEDEIAAFKSAISGALSPSVMLILTLALLKTYFPQETIKELLGKFGFARRPSKKLLVGAFAGGIAFVLFFSKVLMNYFPPDQFVEPHPANVINYAPVWGKLLFALSVITIVPVAEEFLFRGVLYQGIARSWGKIISAFSVSLVFVMLHPDTIESGYWLSHLSLYAFPFIVVVVREITGALYAPIMVHSGFNFAEIVF